MRAAGLEPRGPFRRDQPGPPRAPRRSGCPDADWHDDLAALPEDGPLLVVANEFFDALPVRQLVATEAGWRERLVALDGERFVPAAGPPVPAAAVPDHVRAAPPGTVLETSPASLAHARELAAALAMQGGAALIVDYGHDRTCAGETLQAVRVHDYADPWMEPGEARPHRPCRLRGAGPGRRRGRGACPWAGRPGRVAGEAGHRRPRRERSRETAPNRVEELKIAAAIASSRHDQMGRLFRVAGLSSPGWPAPEGFS